MRNLRTLAVVLSCSSIPAVPARAQTLQQSPLILGQPVSFSVTGTTPPAVAVFLLSPTGLGTGPCFPAPVQLCLELLDPLSILAVTPADGAGTATLGFVLPESLPLVPVFTQALTIELGGAAATFARTNARSAAIQPLDVLGDSFDGTTLAARWQIHNPQLVTVAVGGGSLRLTPTTAGPQATWYQDQEGPLLWQSITGNFTVTAVVRAENPNQPGQPPPVNYRLGGLTLRDPRAGPGQKNYCHVALGAGTAAVPIAAEDKTTVNSTSDFRLYPIATPAAELRITRQGPVVSLYVRPPGAPAWQLLRAHDRPDLPASVQVGPMAYSNQAPPDIRVVFDEVRFAR